MMSKQAELPPTAGAQGEHGPHCGLAAFEIAWIFLIFFLFAASIPPDVGESHYLVKAKHYWQPAWCAGDLFCESLDAHGVFYWTFGWLTRLASLAATAWIGRLLTWLLLAWSWQRLSWAVVPRPLVSLLSAGLLLLLLRNFHVAGEWIVGGVEAKGFAYVLVFLALEAIVRNRWPVALLLAGAAGAFHVLVGGWLAVAIGLAWFAVGKERPALTRLVPAALGGLVLALPGLLPAVALNSGVPKEVTTEAARIYVFERLSHHLVYHRFEPLHIWRYGCMLAAWMALVWLVRRETNLRRLNVVVAGAVVIGLVGVAIDQGLVHWANATGRSAREYELAAAPWLRYYWFRLSDSLVPIGAALSVCYGLERMTLTRPRVANWLLVAAMVAAGANLADVCYWRAQQRIPGAILQPRPTPDSTPRWWFTSEPTGTPARSASEGAPRNDTPPTADEWYGDWRAACAWIEQNTPPDAKFVTPREQQAFKWYAGRPEIVTTKDIPQDARGILAWRAALREVYPRTRAHWRHDLAAFSDDELIALSHKYGASFIVIDQTRAHRAIGLPQVYPLFAEDNPSFAVYRVPPQAE